MICLLFIKNELTLVCFFACAQSIFSFLGLYRSCEKTINAKHFSIMQIVQPHLTRCRAKSTLCESHSTLSVTTITEAVSRYLELRLILTVDYYAYANTRNNLRVFLPSFCPFFPFQITKSQVLQAILIHVGSG